DKRVFKLIYNKLLWCSNLFFNCRNLCKKVVQNLNKDNKNGKMMGIESSSSSYNIPSPSLCNIKPHRRCSGKSQEHIHACLKCIDKKEWVKQGEKKGNNSSSFPIHFSCKFVDNKC